MRLCIQDYWNQQFTRFQILKPYTGQPNRMSHRKLGETKQQPSRARSGHQFSCCLVSLHFLCDILSGRPVLATKWQIAAWSIQCGNRTMWYQNWFNISNCTGCVTSVVDVCVYLCKLSVARINYQVNVCVKYSYRPIRQAMQVQFNSTSLCYAYALVYHGNPSTKMQYINSNKKAAGTRKVRIKRFSQFPKNLHKISSLSPDQMSLLQSADVMKARRKNKPCVFLLEHQPPRRWRP